MKYRIVYNGLKYRVQWLRKTLILRRSKWHWLKRGTYAGSYIRGFSSKEEAHNAIVQDKIKVYTNKQGYKPIDGQIF